MTDLWDIPESPDLIEELPVYVKPDWRGVWARLVGVGLWLCEHLWVLVIVLSAVALGGMFIATPVGPVVTVVAGVLTLGALVAMRAGVSGWATRVLDDFVQAIDGRVYVQRGRDLDKRPIDQSMLAHEWCHHWQQATRGKLRYVLGYYLRREYRRHCEAMAYGLEVAWYDRHPENAARSAARPEYGMRWEPADARVLIDAYAARFRREWGPDSTPTAEIP